MSDFQAFFNVYQVVQRCEKRRSLIQKNLGEKDVLARAEKLTEKNERTLGIAQQVLKNFETQNPKQCEEWIKTIEKKLK